MASSARCDNSNNECMQFTIQNNEQHKLVAMNGWRDDKKKLSPEIWNYLADDPKIRQAALVFGCKESECVQLLCTLTAFIFEFSVESVFKCVTLCAYFSEYLSQHLRTIRIWGAHTDKAGYLCSRSRRFFFFSRFTANCSHATISCRSSFPWSLYCCVSFFCIIIIMWQRTLYHRHCYHYN